MTLVAYYNFYCIAALCMLLQIQFMCSVYLKLKIAHSSSQLPSGIHLLIAAVYSC